MKSVNACITKPSLRSGPALAAKPPANGSLLAAYWQPIGSFWQPFGSFWQLLAAFGSFWRGPCQWLANILPKAAKSCQ
jgi:hypothetical protein